MRALLFDAARCTGCGLCVAACAEQNGLPEPAGDDLSAKQYTALRTARGGEGEIHYRRLCMHCLDPACASVCPVGAMKKRPEGAVVYSAAACMGCRYCLQACAFGAPRYEWRSLTPGVGKCSLCADRIRSGKMTACAEACPAGATTFGEREALLREARARLEAEAGKYVPGIYGEREVGGTCVLYISPLPFRALGLPENLPRHPLPELTLRALSQVPPLAGGAALALAGLWWLTNRKQEVERKEGGDKSGKGRRV